MQETLRGIVLRTVRYGDTSLIVDLFTESHGRMSFMASTLRAKRSVRSVSFWQPLSMVEFSAELLPNGGKLPRPSDVRTYYNYIDLPFSPIKSTLALFLAEFLSAALREEKENTPLYRYIESSLQWLDLADSPASIANFHLAFLMHLSRFIGIYPNLDVSGNPNPNLNLNPNPPLSAVNSPLSTVHFQLSTLHSPLSTLNSQLYFDLLAGTYCDRQPSHAHFLRNEEARVLPVLFRMNYPTMHLFRLSRRERQRILHVLNEYYRLHVPGFPELKSLEILQELFS
ncbi:MAG: DNA repair protein RecO [Bacteroidaceae bacterium]|nr:DNA repair protein RecO [Prevotellaceae bacterium]MDY5761173.1 DNA repair protein RecO [Bacteroidaceae bacterium]